MQPVLLPAIEHAFSYESIHLIDSLPLIASCLQGFEHAYRRLV